MEQILKSPSFDLVDSQLSASEKKQVETNGLYVGTHSLSAELSSKIGVIVFHSYLWYNLILFEVRKGFFDGAAKLVHELGVVLLGGVLHHVVDQVEEDQLLLDPHLLDHLYS